MMISTRYGCHQIIRLYFTSFDNFVHDFLDCIAGIVKRNFLCIVIFAAILVPLPAQCITLPDFLHDFRVLC